MNPLELRYELYKALMGLLNDGAVKQVAMGGVLGEVVKIDVETDDPSGRTRKYVISIEEVTE